MHYYTGHYQYSHPSMTVIYTDTGKITIIHTMYYVVKVSKTHQGTKVTQFSSVNHAKVTPGVYSSNWVTGTGSLIVIRLLTTDQ